MAEEQAAHHLLNVIEERGLNVDLDKVLLCFEDGDTSADTAAWVENYLHSETLLTKEELELYQSLKKKGSLQQYESEGEPIRPILDQDIASAIESLQTATAAIEEQCKILEAQKSALVRLKALDKPNLDVEHARNERRRKEGQEKARLDVAIEDVTTYVGDQLAESQKEIETDKSTLSGYLSERISSDDQILSRLPGIVSKIVAENEGPEDEKSIEQWCKAIVSFRTAEIKARVDAVFLKNLSTESSNGQSEATEESPKERKAALQTEMEELHSEIASISEMVVEHELRKPLSEIKERRDRDTVQARGAWLNYVLSTLEYMGKRLDAITKTTQEADHFQHAIAQISEAASKRLPDTTTVQATPSRRGTTSVPSLAFTPMVKLKPSRTLDLPAALQDVLRHIGIPFNQDSIEALQDSLLRIQTEKQTSLTEHYESTASTTQDTLAERSSRVDSETRMILGALYKHTQFGQVQLIDAKVDAQIKVLEKEIDNRNQDVLEAEANELSLSDPKVKAFVAEYGR